MTRRMLRFGTLAGLVLLVAASDAWATHFRYGTIRWRPQVITVGGQPVTQPNVIVFTLTTTWRRTYFIQNFSITPVVGTVLPAVITFTFGDNTAGVNVTPTVTAVSTTEDWVETTFTVTHTYPASNSSYLAGFSSAARISTLQDGNADSAFTVQTVVPISMSTPNSSPVSGTLPIITVPHNSAAATFSIAASDPDANPMTFSIAPTSRSGLFKAAPNGLAINSTSGLVTWDTRQAVTGIVLNGLYAIQFLVTDSRGASIPVDVILRTINATAQPPTLLINGSSSAASFTVQVGSPLTFTIMGTDPNIDPGTGQANRFVTLSGSGIPLGAVLNPSLPVTLRSPANSTFTWTPNTSSVGTHVLTFAVTSDTGQQDTNTVTISVPQFNRAPTISCVSPVTVKFGSNASVPVTVADPDADALTVTWTVDGSLANTVNVPASGSPTVVPFSQNFGGVGTYAVSVRVEDPKGLFATCSTSVTVENADQTITFAPLADRTYGVAPFGLSASASSGLDVTLAIQSGPASLTQNMLTVTGIGLVTVLATQAGDGSYNAAPPVVQSFTVAPAAVTITVAAANTVYTGLAYAGATTCAATGVNGETPPASLSYEDNAGTPQSGPPTNAGSYAVKCSAGGGNYAAAFKKASFSIAPASLSIAVTAAGTVYTGLPYQGATSCSAAGVNGESPAATLSFRDNAQQPIGVPRNAGSYYALCSSGGPNYVPASATAAFAIAPAVPVVSASAQNATYTALPYAGATTCSATGVNNEAPPATASFETAGGALLSGPPSGAGKYVLKCSAGGGNYASASTAAPFDILAATLVGSFTADSKPYDGTTAAAISSRSLSGVLGTDDVSLVGGTATFDTKNAGLNKLVTATGFALAGARKDNYTLASVTNAVATIAPKSVTGAFTAANKVYDGNTTATITNRSLAGVIPGDDTVLSGGVAHFDTRHVGIGKPVTGELFGLAGGTKDNYSLGVVAATTANITATALTGSFTVGDKTYDGTIAATIVSRSLNGYIDGDAVTLIGGTASFDTKHAGNGKPVAGTGFALDGADKNNYALGAVSGAAAAILRKPVTGAFTAADKVYDGTVLAAISGRSLASSISGDDVALAGGTAAFDTPTVGTGKVVTGTGFSLAGAAKDDYVLASVINALASITRKSLTITASSPDPIVVGAPAPSIAPGYDGFVASETAATALSTPPQCSTAYTPASGVGTYPTSCSGAVAANYAISYLAGSFKAVFGWDGFLQPINDTAHQIGVTQSKFKAGQTIPAKFVIRNAAGAVVTQSGLPTFTRSGNRGACDPTAMLESAEAVAADSVPVYTWDGAQYHYNWNTKGLSAGVYRIYANLADSTQQWVDICLTK